jgi:RHS repeat-associated protein
MQLSSGTPIPDGILAAIALRNENSRLGVPSQNPALHQGIDPSKSQTAMGLQSLTSTTRIGSRSTGKERDQESGLDYMDARYYGSNMGRFMSPDPVFASKYKVADPQQWNMYAYARNNPLSITDPTGLDFNITGCGNNSATCQNNMFGTTSTDANGKSSFSATVISNGADGGLVDQHGNSYSGSFDQSGFHFSSSDGSVSGGGQFIHNSAETDVNGSGIFSGIQGKFVSDCGGTCQGRGSLYETQAGAFGAMEGSLNKQGGLTTALDLLSGAHNSGTQWKDSDGLVHVILNGAGTLNAGKMEMHFEGHPTGVDVTKFVLHMVDTIHDKTSGNANTEKNRVLP